MDALRKELREYYCAHTFRQLGGQTQRNPFQAEMDAWAQAHPSASALELKTAQYEIIAERFTPVIFRNSPFFSEMGVRIAEYDGTAMGPGAWLMRRNGRLWEEESPEQFRLHHQFSSAGFHICYGPFVDPDHHCFPFSAVLSHGLGHFYREFGKGEQNEFSEMTRRSLLAVRRIAEKFAEAASRIAVEPSSSGPQKRNLERVAAAARRVPWEPAGSFYEGLCVLWFLHEVCASIDGVGMSVLGRPDFQLTALYRRDLANGVLTREEAYDLICRWMVQTDCKLDLDRPLVEQFNVGEQGDTLILGGCDEHGDDCCSELTHLFLRAHRELKLIYPKIHFRYNARTPQEFLHDACADFMNGRNTVSFLNDDILIPAQVKAGKRLEDARSYVAGGCWEVIIEGCEHAQGANCYINLARVLDMSIHHDPELESRLEMKFRKLDGAADFEQAYHLVMDNEIEVITRLCDRLRIGSRPWSRVNPAPFFSAALNDCLEKRRDYSDGGGRYHPHGLPLASLSVLIDSLSAIRSLCFEQRLCTLPELLDAVRSNWDGAERLRHAALAAPRYGSSDECAQLASRVLGDIIDSVSRYNAEHGEFHFQPGLYNYRDIIDWSSQTRATPDGRRQGDFLTQGLTPQRYSHSLSVTDILRTAGALPLEDFPANSVLTLTLQRRGMSVQILSALIRNFPGGMLQLNCLDHEELLDAVAHPERHADLIVRLYGYSARFISLSGKMQEEFISRTIL
mgnify:CR=1 FL=1